MIATFSAVNRNWKEVPGEADEKVQQDEQEKEGDTDNAFHQQDLASKEKPSPEQEKKRQRTGRGGHRRYGHDKSH